MTEIRGAIRRLAGRARRRAGGRPPAPRRPDRPPAGRGMAHGRMRIILASVAAPVAAVAAAFAAMLAVAAAGLRLAGLGGVRPAAAVVSLAVGGAVRLSAAGAAGPPGAGPSRPAPGGGILGVQGAIEGVPLGVALAGALAMAAVRLAPVRWPALGGGSDPGRGLAGRLAGPALTVAAFLLVLAGVAGAGRGTVPLGSPGVVLGYRPDLARTLVGGLVWVVVVLAATARPLWRGGPAFPGGSASPAGPARPGGAVGGGFGARAWRTLRPVLRAGIAVAAGVGVASMLTGVALGTFVHNGRMLAGLALLVGPNAAGAFLTFGLRVPWSAAPIGAPAGHRPPAFGLSPAGPPSGGWSPFGLPSTALPSTAPPSTAPPSTAPPSTAPPSSGRPSLGLPPAGRLPSGLGHGLTWQHLAAQRLLATLAVSVVLVLVAALALRWSANRPGGPGARATARDALWFGSGLGAVLAATVPVLARLAGGSFELGVSLLGFTVARVGLRLAAHWWVGVPAGAVAGVLAGTAVILAARLAGTGRDPARARILGNVPPRRSG